MEEHGKNVLRKQAGEEFLGGLLVDVVDVGGAELFGFFVGLGGVGGLNLDARGERGFGGALLFFSGGLDGAGNLRVPKIDERQQRSTTRRCAMTDLNSL